MRKPRSRYEIAAWERLDWQVVYGSDWRDRARNLARYFGKQLGCMLATYQLPVPQELIEFLNGSERCPSVCFMLYINPRATDAHEQMRRDGFEDALPGFVGLLPSQAYEREGEFSGIDYGYHIGYLWFLVQWRTDHDVTSWFEYQEIDLPRLSEEA